MKDLFENWRGHLQEQELEERHKLSGQNLEYQGSGVWYKSDVGRIETIDKEACKGEWKFVVTPLNKSISRALTDSLEMATAYLTGIEETKSKLQ